MLATLEAPRVLLMRALGNTFREQEAIFCPTTQASHREPLARRRPPDPSPMALRAGGLCEPSPRLKAVAQELICKPEAGSNDATKLTKTR